MNYTRRELLTRAGKAAGAVALAGVVGTSVVKTASAHVNIEAEIEISMGEMFFQAAGQDKGAAIRVPANKAVRLKFKNDGVVLHDVHFGRDADLDRRLYKENLSTPFDMLEYPAGGEAWLTFTFSDAQKGEWELGCFQPGHYEAGMKTPFIVE